MKIDTARAAAAIELDRPVVVATEPPIDRVQIAWYMVASCDFNPIHVDEPFAREAGFGTVIGQGMLPLGFLARELVKRVGQARLRSLSGDFVAPVLPGDALTLELRPAARRTVAGRVELDWILTATGADGKARVRARATSWHESIDGNAVRGVIA